VYFYYYDDKYIICNYFYLVGYGDFYPSTMMGKTLSIFMTIIGILWGALITVAFFQYLNFNSTESKVC